MQYSELSGFFYGWLRVLLPRTLSAFQPESTPTAIDAETNSFRHGSDSRVLQEDSY
jgi:hypothetical protein